MICQYRERSQEGARGGLQGGVASAAVTGDIIVQDEEAGLFEGLSKVDGTACICPQLVHWISVELMRTAEIDKAARKVREARVMARGAEHLSKPPLSVDLPNECGKRQKGGKAQR